MVKICKDLPPKTTIFLRCAELPVFCLSDEVENMLNKPLDGLLKVMGKAEVAMAAPLELIQACLAEVVNMDMIFLLSIRLEQLGYRMLHRFDRVV